MGQGLSKKIRWQKLKAWQVEEEYATIVFVETRNKAKYLATQYDETLHEYNYVEVKAIRIPQLDKYAGNKPYVMDFENDKDGLIMMCLESDYDDCEKCVVKDYCGEYQDYLENRENKTT